MSALHPHEIARDKWEDAVLKFGRRSDEAKHARVKYERLLRAHLKGDEGRK